MSKRLIAMLVGVATLAMLMGGCGGSEDEPLTKAEFIKQGDALCTKANKEFGREFKAFVLANKDKDKGKPQSIEEEGIKVGEEIFIPNAQARGESLAELSPPSGDEDEIAAILDAIEEGAEKAEEDPASLYNTGADYPFAKANKLQQEYGFKFCGAGIAG